MSLTFLCVEALKAFLSTRLELVLHNTYFMFIFSVARDSFPPYRELRIHISRQLADYVNSVGSPTLYHTILHRMPTLFRPFFARLCFLYWRRCFRHLLNTIYSDSVTLTSETNLFRLLFTECFPDHSCYVCGSHADHLRTVLGCLAHRVCHTCVSNSLHCPGAFLGGYAGTCNFGPIVPPCIDPSPFNPGEYWDMLPLGTLAADSPDPLALDDAYNSFVIPIFI